MELTTLWEDTPRYTVFVVVTLNLTESFMPSGVESSTARREKIETENINNRLKNFFILITHNS